MKKKFMLYLAASGTYDASTTTLYLTPMTINESTIKADMKEVKKQLKFSNVVVSASPELIQNIKIDYILVVPKVSVDNVFFYRALVKDSKENYMYPITVVRLKNTTSKYEIKRIELVKEMKLEEYIEGTDSIVN
jgi:hypothetical protein